VNCPGCDVPEGALHKPGCLQKVVDDYILMERKARAWDELRRRAEDWAAIEITLAQMDALVQSAPSAA